MKNSFFYNTKDIKELKELIRTGEKITKIAKRECERFNTTPVALSAKLYELKKTTRKIQAKSVKTLTTKTLSPVNETKGVLIPEGTTFEGNSKKVVIFKDHFRIYF
jgi:hypothetical protein